MEISVQLMVSDIRSNLALTQWRRAMSFFTSDLGHLVRPDQRQETYKAKMPLGWPDSCLSEPLGWQGLIPHTA